MRSYGIAQDRNGEAERKRGPPDCNPMAQACAPARPSRGVASGLNQDEWLEPEPDSDPRNSAPEKEFELKADFEDLFEIAKQLQKL